MRLRRALKTTTKITFENRCHYVVLGAGLLGEPMVEIPDVAGCQQDDADISIGAHWVSVYPYADGPRKYRMRMNSITLTDHLQGV